MIKKYNNILIEKIEKGIVLPPNEVPVYFNHDKAQWAGNAMVTREKTSGNFYADITLDITFTPGMKPIELYPSVGLLRLDDGGILLKELGLCTTQNLDLEIKPLIIRT